MSALLDTYAYYENGEHVIQYGRVRTYHLQKPVTSRNIKTIAVMHKEDLDGLGSGVFRWNVVCFDQFGRQRGTIYIHEDFPAAVDCAEKMLSHLRTYYP